VHDIDALGDLRGQRVLLRADLNVPLDGSRISDDGRIRAVLPTIQRLVTAGARVIVCSHLGRPEGRPEPRYSLRPVATRLGELLGASVKLADDVVGPSARRVVAELADGSVGLLENLRFEPGETSRDDAVRGAFADQLAGFADVYVGDGFGAVHRRHASVWDAPRRLPRAAGGLILREVEVLRGLVADPARPYVVVLGGSKVSDKLAVIDSLLPRVDVLLVGGGMCYTFLAAQGFAVGNSLLEPDRFEACRRFLATGKVVLPVDVVVAPEISAEAPTQTVAVDAIPAGWRGLDIGPATVARFREELEGAQTVFWNGPLGVVELAPFAAGTRGVAEAVAALGTLTVVGGGDSAAALVSLGIDPARFAHVSTGGGASLAYLEGRTLPGLAALEG